MSASDKNEGLMYPNLCWLIESDYLSNGTNHYFTADCSGSKVPWTTDPNEALRFPTKGAADYAIRYYSLLEHRPRVSDHMFGCGISPAPSAVLSHNVTFEKWLSYQPWHAPEHGGFKLYDADTVRAAWEATNAAPQPPVTPHRSMPGLGESPDSANGDTSRQPCETGSGDMAAAAAPNSSARATYPDALKLAHRICEEMAHWEEEPAKDSQDDHTLALSSALLSTYQALADLADEWERHAEAFQQVYRQNKSYERAKAALDGQLCVSTDLRAAPPQFDPLTKEKP